MTQLRNSAALGAVTSVLCVALGTAFAWLIVRTDMPWRRTLSSLLLIPLLFSPLMSTLAWLGLAGPRAGLLNVFMEAIFGGEPPVRFNVFSFFGMVLIMVLHYTPYVYIAVRAALTNMDSDLEYASEVLGAPTLTTMRTVTLPIVKPAILGSGLLVFVLAAENFTVPAIIGVNIGFSTVPQAIYAAIHGFPSNPARGSALGLLLLAFTSIGMFVYLRTIRQASRYVTISGKGGKARPIKLPGALGWVGTGSVVLFLAIGVVLPYMTLIFGSFARYFATRAYSLDLFTLDHYVNLFGSAQARSAMRNTLVIVLIGATGSVLFATFVSWISIRSRSKARRIVDYLASMPIMIPGVALGLGTLWAFIYIPTGLYGTIWIIIVALIVKQLGHGSRIASSALMQMSPELEEAARTLGSSRVRTFFTVTLGVLRAPLGSAWVLVAIFISLEVSTSVMLITGTSLPMSVLVFLTMEGGVVSEAFAAAALLSTAVLILITIAQRRFRVFEQF